MYQKRGHILKLCKENLSNNHFHLEYWTPENTFICCFVVCFDVVILGPRELFFHIFRWCFWKCIQCFFTLLWGYGPTTCTVLALHVWNPNITFLPDGFLFFIDQPSLAQVLSPSSSVKCGVLFCRSTRVSFEHSASQQQNHTDGSAPFLVTSTPPQGVASHLRLTPVGWEMNLFHQPSC